MHKTNNLIPKYIGASFVIVFLLFGLSVTLASRWFESFIRPGDYLLYLSIFFSFMWLCLIIGNYRLLNINTGKQLVLGAMVGYSVSVLALFITNYFAFPDSSERFSNTIERLGADFTIIALLITLSARSLLLGGWFFGLISIPLLKPVLVVYPEAQWNQGNSF